MHALPYINYFKNCRRSSRRFYPYYLMNDLLLSSILQYIGIFAMGIPRVFIMYRERETQCSSTNLASRNSPESHPPHLLRGVIPNRITLQPRRGRSRHFRCHPLQLRQNRLHREEELNLMDLQYTLNSKNFRETLFG